MALKKAIGAFCESKTAIALAKRTLLSLSLTFTTLIRSWTSSNTT